MIVVHCAFFLKTSFRQALLLENLLCVSMEFWYNLVIACLDENLRLLHSANGVCHWLGCLTCGNLPFDKSVQVCGYLVTGCFLIFVLHWTFPDEYKNIYFFHFTAFLIIFKLARNLELALNWLVGYLLCVCFQASLSFTENLIMLLSLVFSSELLWPYLWVSTLPVLMQ